MSTNKKPRSVFSSAINDLVRSAIGGNARQVPDQDLDSYVADLITSEAQAKQAKYKTHGVRAYQPNPDVAPPSSNPLKPNKRFLMNIMKATDSHNQSVIREAEEKAKAFQAKRRKQEEMNSKGNSRRQQQHNRKRKRSHESDDEDRQNDSNTTDSNSDDHSNASNDDDNDENDDDDDDDRNDDNGPRIQYRGRGKVRNGSSMDKYFDDGYDAAKDMDSDQDTPSEHTHKKQKKGKESSRKSSKSSKHSKSSKKKKHRHRSSKKSKKSSSK
ncbi:hypothetical protein BCR42DRAFT_490241 [Absidia repens]|uniref:Uncharacterized protein n=1 Tax=Absidia repens TaxID=90262 RepID=A0A1X2IMF7_9FUNG|nr:hypothetical protein BCR42DRAFT_490241 [Absidia repens]